MRELAGLSPITSKTLVNRGSNKVVNIASTKSRQDAHRPRQIYLTQRYGCRGGLVVRDAAQRRGVAKDEATELENAIAFSNWRCSRITPDWSPPCRVPPAPPPAGRSARGRASTRHSRGRSHGRTRRKRDRRHARRRFRP